MPATPAPTATPTAAPTPTPTPLPGPATVNLGLAGNYAVLTKTGITAANASEHVTGDMGVDPIDHTAITGFAMTAVGDHFSSAMVTGTIWASNTDSRGAIGVSQARLDMETAYTNASPATRTPPTDAAHLNLAAGSLLPWTVFTPGLYHWGSDVNIPSGGITLAGNATSVWIFQVQGNLNDNGGLITLTGGALPQNVFWQVTGTTTLFTASQFKGIVLGKTDIVLQGTATFLGRALSQTQVTLAGSSSITKPN